MLAPIPNPSLPLNFDYTASKFYCHQIGLIWLGDDFVRAADADALTHHLTQDQVDTFMRHHLWQVKWLFMPKNYSYKNRLKMALFFLTGYGA